MSNPCDTGRSTAADLPALLPERAFVVEFSSDGATARDDDLSGRVEHVVSGQAARFASAGELLEFVQGVLRSGTSTRKQAR
jgi:hypothetical protein